MTDAERLRSEAYNEGYQDGYEEGYKEGQEESGRQYLIALLQARFGALPEAVLVAIGAAEKPQLDRWFHRGITARSLDDVFSSVP